VTLVLVQIYGRPWGYAELLGDASRRAIRCFVGGLIMGIGFSVGPGSFSGLTFFGQPLLLPYAWVVMGAAYCAILLGLAYLRSTFGDWIKTRRS
jgi:hypothetical protein